MNNLKIKKGLKTLILLGTSFALIPSSIGCKKNQSKELEVVEVIEQPTVSPTLEPTLIPTMEPTAEPTATPGININFIPEPAEEDKKYYSGLSDEDLSILEEQVSKMYDDVMSAEPFNVSFKDTDFTKENLVNYLYLYSGRGLKYQSTDYKELVDLLNVFVYSLYVFDISYFVVSVQYGFEWKHEEFLSNFIPKDTEEYRLIRNMEHEWKETSMLNDDEKLIEYFQKYVDLCANKRNEEQDISNMSPFGLMNMGLLLAGQSVACFEKFEGLDLDVGHGMDPNEEYYYQLDDYFMKFAIQNLAKYEQDAKVLTK